MFLPHLGVDQIHYAYIQEYPVSLLKGGMYLVAKMPLELCAQLWRSDTIHSSSILVFWRIENFVLGAFLGISLINCSGEGKQFWFPWTLQNEFSDRKLQWADIRSKSMTEIVTESSLS